VTLSARAVAKALGTLAGARLIARPAVAFAIVAGAAVLAVALTAVAATALKRIP
jgi:hypothetical protein